MDITQQFADLVKQYHEDTGTRITAVQFEWTDTSCLKDSKYFLTDVTIVCKTEDVI